MPGSAATSTAIAAITLFALLFIAHPAQANSTLPSVKTETFNYALKWGLMLVGNATLESRCNDDTRSFRLEGSSTWYVDLLFPVRTSVNSTCTKDYGQALSYSKRYREGDRLRSFNVSFDREDNLARRKDRVNKINSVLPFNRDLLDPLSVFFAFRRGRPGQNLIIPVCDGIRMVWGKAEYIGQGELSVPAGDFSALHYKVDLGDVDGIFFTRDYTPYEVWVSNDKQRLPLKLEAPIRIGPYTGTLTGVLCDTNQ